jgi:type I restriction enzyme S subunit
MSWRSYKFGDFLTRSKIPVTIQNDETYKRVTIKTKHQGVSIRDTEKGSKIGTKKQFILKSGQFVLSKIDARYGAFGIAPNEVDGAIITGNFWAYDVDFTTINIEWFNQFTNSKDFYDVCERASSGITHRKYLNEGFFLNYKIELPSIDEQLEIIEKFKENQSTLENQSAELTQQLNLVKQLRQAFLREAMQGKLVPQDPNDEPASVLLEKIKAEKERLIQERKIKKQKPLPPITKDEIPFEIPENWVWCRLREISVIGTGATPLTSNDAYYKNGTIPWITSSATNNLFVESPEQYITEKALKETNCKIYPAGTLVVAMYGQGKTRGQVTELMFSAATNQACATITLHMNDFFLRKFVKLFFQKIYLEIRELAQGGAQPNLNMSKVSNTIIPLPPLAEQQRIVAKLDELMQYCDKLEASIKESQSQNELLLQQVLREALEPKT